MWDHADELGKHLLDLQEMIMGTDLVNFKHGRALFAHDDSEIRVLRGALNVMQIGAKFTVEKESCPVVGLDDGTVEVEEAAILAETKCESC